MARLEVRRFYGGVIVIALWLASFSGLYPQYQLSALAHQIIPDLGLTSSQFSGIFSAPMIPAVFLSFFSGVLADRFGPKKVIGAGLIIAAIGTCLRLKSETGTQLFVLMMMSGFGSAFLTANAAKIIGAWHPPEKIGKMMGVYLMSSTLAMAVGTGTTAYFPSVRSAYMAAGGGCIAATLFWIFFMKDQPANAALAPAPQPIKKLLAVAARSRSVWLTGGCLMFTLGCVISLTAFLPNALVSTYGIDPKTAGLISALITLGSLAGSLAGPLVCQKIGLMRPFIMGAGLIAAGGTAFAWQAPVGILMGSGLLVTGFALGAILPLLMSVPVLLPEIGPAYAGSAGGITSTLQLLGAVIIPTYVITPVSGDNYGILFGMAGICMVCMTLMVFLLPELGTKAGQKLSEHKQSKGLRRGVNPIQ